MSNTSALARQAASKEQWPESLSSWRQVKAEDGEREAQIKGVALALRRIWRFDEAEASLVEGISDLKGSVNLEIEYAWTVLDRGQSDLALRRLDKIAHNEPEHAFVLGDNCEFGGIKRHYDAKPLGLLRRAAITPQNPSEGLETRFDGLREPDYIVLSMRHGKYFIQDMKYDMHMHAFIRSDVDQVRCSQVVVRASNGA